MCQADINLYYDKSLEIVEKNQKLLGIVLEQLQGSKILGPGRVVVLRDGVRFLMFHFLKQTFITANSIFATTTSPSF